MSKHLRILNGLFLTAQAIEPVARARVAACIVYRRKIISYGICQTKSHPMQSIYCRHPEAIYLHAEICAIKNAISNTRDVDFLKDSTLYIARAKYPNKTWCFGLAKPCEGCQRAIAAFGISNVIYTTDDNNFEVM